MLKNTYNLDNPRIYSSICAKLAFRFRRFFCKWLCTILLACINFPDTVYVAAKTIGSRMARNRAWKLDSKWKDSRVSYTKYAFKSMGPLPETSFLSPELSVGRITVVRTYLEQSSPDFKIFWKIVDII